MYTEAETKALEAYPEATVEELAESLGKSQRSIIAKLAKMGRYRKERTTKNGEEIVTKEDLVAQIESYLDLQLSTLVKAGKQDLRALLKRLKGP